jgi:hypothetical protein
MVPLLAVMEEVQNLHVPSPDHSLEGVEAYGAPRIAVLPIMQQMVLLACFYSL